MTRIFLGLALFLPLHAYSQMSQVYQDDQFLISRIYAGINSTTLFSTDSISSQAAVNFRLGIKADLILNEHITFKTWGAIQMSKNQPVAGYNSFELMTRLTPKLTWHAGLIATPTTVLRPNPTTWESQVETRTQSTIIPGKPGTKLAYAFAENASITYGLFNHGVSWAHHVNLSVYDWHLAGYRLNDGKYFAALTYQKDWLDHTITFSSENELTSSAFVNVRGGVSFVADAQYILDQSELKFLETGIRKYVNAMPVHLSGFFGLTYDWKTGMVLGQIFIHLI